MAVAILGMVFAVLAMAVAIGLGAVGTAYVLADNDSAGKAKPRVEVRNEGTFVTVKVPRARAIDKECARAPKEYRPRTMEDWYRYGGTIDVPVEDDRCDE